MGNPVKTPFLKKKGLLIGSACMSALALCLFCSAFGSDNWISAYEIDSNKFYVSVNYGLFNGKKTVNKVATSVYSLHIVCDSGQGVCMYSCANSEGERQAELAGAINGNFTAFVCDVALPGTRLYSSRLAISIDSFMNYGLWLSTVFFLVVTIVTSFVTFLFTLYNVVGNPIRTVFGPQGLYGWNAAALGFSILPLALWAGQFVAFLSRNPMISESITEEFKMENSSQLDSSYWLILGGALCHIANIPLVRFRNILRDPPPVVTGEDDDSNVGGTILLF